MDALTATAFVFLAGLTLSGLCGTLIEIVAGRRLSLREPFVSPSNVSRSLVLVLLAGPFMTCNEALAAIREQRIGRVIFVCIISSVACGLPPPVSSSSALSRACATR